MFDFSVFATSEAWFSLLMLTFMEVVLGIDNVIFITIVANKLPDSQQPRARNIGLILAMVFRILLLFGIQYINLMVTPIFQFSLFGHHEVMPTGQSIILMAGGLFLMYKATSEIHHKLEGEVSHAGTEGQVTKAFNQVVMQIFLINIVFSFDSILTAIGLTPHVSVMMLGVVISVGLMMLFAGALGRFIDKHPSLQMLGLSFLIMIGFMLVAEGAHKMHLVHPEDPEADIVPKGYLYFAIFFSLAVEVLNIVYRKKSNPVQLRGNLEDAEQLGLLNNEDSTKSEESINSNQ